MRTGYIYGFTLLIAFTLLCTGCAKEGGKPNDTTVSDSGTTSTQAEAGEAARHPQLAGTEWQLVQIMSMDDSIYVPNDRSRYTLRFAKDGTVNMLVDCNRGTGSWVSEFNGQLRFGKIAATRALCPPGSLHDRFLAQFDWVRSYVVEKGHLYLATEADGSIIEFEPLKR